MTNRSRRIGFGPGCIGGKHPSLTDPDPERSQRVMRAMLEMRKLDIAGLERAAEAA